MGILALIISILKIIGIILLIILALILLILLILLFSSIKFEAIAKIINKEPQFIVNIKYLFGIIKYKYDYEKNESLLKIFGRKLNNKKTEDLKEEISKEKILEDLQETQKETQKDIKKDIIKSNENLEKNEHKTKKQYNTKESLDKENIKKDKNFNFKNLLKSLYEENILKICKNLIKNLIKAIKIKKIKINFEYGLFEPYETGKICGIISIILPIFKKKYLKNIKLTPNFEEEKFIGYGYIKLKTNIFKILFPILIFILKKPIRKIIFRKGE